MPCPFDHKTLRRLPGQDHDQSARAERQRILGGADNLEMLLKEAKGKNAHGIRVSTYAGASVVIDHYWPFIVETERRLRPFSGNFKAQYAGAPHEKQVSAFMAYLHVVANQARDNYSNALKERVSKGPIDNDADRVAIYFMEVGRKRHRKLGGLPMPSPDDLTTVFGRMVQIAPAVFERDMGRAPSQEELFALFRHPSVMRFFIDMMSNSRELMYPLFATMEGTKRQNLNDSKRRFNPERFEVATVGNTQVFRLKASVLEEMHRRCTEMQARRAKRGSKAPVALGCPALYTGKFREMYEWTLLCFEDWMAEALPLLKTA